jgi:MarR family transcriptional regulator, organic hydroperoxide resistance regulator
MKRNGFIALLDRTTENARKFIVGELATHGIEGIVPTHGDILVRLFSGERYTMKDLAEKIHRTQPTVTVLVDKLVAYGYVVKEKCNEDNRITFIRLTEKGWALQSSFAEMSDHLNAAVFKGLSGAEVDFVCDILGKINRNLNK